MRQRFHQLEYIMKLSLINDLFDFMLISVGDIKTKEFNASSLSTSLIKNIQVCKECKTILHNPQYAFLDIIV